jgi:uncharacterized membrane-anchored protein
MVGAPRAGMTFESPRSTGGLAHATSRVPAITAWFWIAKILTTGAGETTSDFLGHRFEPPLVAGVGVVLLVAALALQFRMRRYVAWTYWLAVSMVAVFGTMFADVLHAVDHSYLVSTIAFLVILLAIFALWYRSEGTLSIHSITTRRRESFYWAAVIATFALGTATGDMTATTFAWGYLASGVAFLVAIVAVGVGQFIAGRVLPGGHRHQSTNSVFGFWLAYVLTRPLGASFADWMGETPAKGGLGWGDGTVSIIAFAIILLLVAYLATTKKDVQVDVVP